MFPAAEHLAEVGHHGADLCAAVHEAWDWAGYRVGGLSGERFTAERHQPLLPHFALVIGFSQWYEKKAGVGTIVALMLPYTLATSVAWVISFFAWYLLGLPFGPR